MKKICISLITLAIIILTIFAAYTMIKDESQPNTEYLRIHIRADSNNETDQNVKYLVRDAVVKFLTPYIAECDTKEKAENMLSDNLSDIEKVADSVLYENGFDYKARASVRVEEFPTRTYGDLTLENGFYKALILELGSGEGNNWWCVVYPPLCFTGGNSGYVVKSKIYEIINDFLKNKESK